MATHVGLKNEFTEDASFFCIPDKNFHVTEQYKEMSSYTGGVFIWVLQLVNR